MRFAKTMKSAMLLLVIAVSSGAYAADKTMSTDIVVVGGGSAGMSAALEAAYGGAKVIVLEKNPYLGGSSNFAEGPFGVESDLQRKKSYGLSKDEAYKHIIEFNHYLNNAPIIRKFVENSASNIEWLTNQGVGLDPIHISVTEPMVWHVILNKGQYIHGGALITTLQAKAKEQGVTFMLRTPAKKLIYDGSKVAGVEAVDALGNTIAIKAKAVIITTGGFGNSKELVRKWTKFDPEKFKPTLPLNKTGDGILMAQKVGAETEGLNLMLHPGTEGKGIIPLGNLYTMTWQPFLWVNKYGERFIDESVAFSFAQSGNAISRQRDAFAWTVFTDEEVKYVMEKGVDNGIGVLVPVTTKLTNLQNEINGALAAGSESFKAADSIEGLARQIGVSPEKLEKTIGAYNKYAENKYDEQFVKDPRWMKPVKSGKYYALKIFPYHFVSIGGIRVNTDMEVTDKKDQAIPGLYAGGCDVGGLYGDTYTLWASGHAYGFAVFSGREAAKSAVKYLKN
ncbi:FAD-dependent oxidoreductase [Geobacter sp. FeAm09]|uniref:FAD-dependent oxidoreductase n=1 Tax=Geobacter sp. FeAm09 TaxID=2597769 RepID=UPI0011EFFAB2|nr:FAD-dependent oxidoreductase [Geobacter sp. FeAm09]QEM67692.1 FAD-dependent oxidoreductase [Geobacter sp. FeAm09]